MTFSKWRGYLWPVHRYELKKLIPMLIIFFLISFDYNVLRTMKDTLVVTEKSSGAEVIPFIKVWVMFPSAILMTFIFTRLSNRFSREKVFYLMMSIFLGYFFIFTFFVYPIRHMLHPHETANWLQAMLPAGCMGLVAMFRNWTLTSFYVMAELWSSAVLTVLFWGFANQVTRLGEAKRFYGLFGIGANLSGVAAGQASVYLSSSVFHPAFPFGNDAWEQSMVVLVSLVILAGIISIFLFRWMNKTVLTDPLYCDQVSNSQEDKIKGHASLREAFGLLTRSRYLLYIAIIVVSYNLVINLVEVVWKHEVKALYPSPIDYNIYMNQVSTVIGIIATLSALFISGNSIRKFGWTFTAMLTPVILLVTSIGFFTFFFLKDNFADAVIALFGTTPLAIVVFFGSAQNIMSRGAKYSVFDATKEMAFVPLSSEIKLKGKAAIDGVGSRFGKSGGSLIHQSLLLMFSTITASAPYVAGFLLAVIFLWTIATRMLGRQFTEITTTGAEAVVKPASLAQPLIIEPNALKEQKAV